jgi:hypothetical protein
MEGKEITGIKDLDLKILMEMDDRELLSICASQNKYFYRICKSEIFWDQRYLKRFASINKEAANYKPINRTWKQHYLQTVIDLDRFSVDPWTFLPYVLWSNKGINFSKYKDSEGEIYPFLEAPEWVMNNFFLLNLGAVMVDGKFYSSITPFQLFKVISPSIPENLLVSGNGLFHNKDIYVGNNL